MLESNDDNELSANDVFSHAVTTVQTTDSPLCSFQLSIGSATEIFMTENRRAEAEPPPASGAAEQPAPVPPVPQQPLQEAQSEPPPAQQLHSNELLREIAQR